MRLADIIQNPDLIKPFQCEESIEMVCTFCDSFFSKKKKHILNALGANQLGSYCSRRCQGFHVQKLNEEIREGVVGRTCMDCSIWYPHAKFPREGRSKVCMKCRRDEPQQKFNLMRGQAKARNIAWTISYDDFLTFWGKACSYCSAEIAMVGFDRINSNQPYHIDNVISCCRICNIGKNDQTQQEFIDRCKRVYAKHQS